MRNHYAVFAFILAILLFGGFTCCGEKAKVERCNVVDYGNGVYYFDGTETKFGSSLSAFISEHPDMELVSMVGDDTDGYGSTKGYFVVFRKK